MCSYPCSTSGDDGRSQPTTENRQKKKEAKKGKLGKARSTQTTGACHTKCYGCADSYHPKTVTENKEAKTENTAKPADPDDIYATLDWDTNPPINGFYEMMMDLTPERRKELQELARQHNEKQAAAEKMEVKAVPDNSP